MTDVDFFDVHSAKDLYEIIHAVYVDYIKHPSERDFLLLVMGFTHLREWISGCSYEVIQAKQIKGLPLTDEENFFIGIYDLPSFPVIQELCNRGKHRNIQKKKFKTSKTQGARAGISKVGDSLSQSNFLINGKDSRDYFIELIKKYNQWFDTHC